VEIKGQTPPARSGGLLPSLLNETLDLDYFQNEMKVEILQ